MKTYKFQVPSNEIAETVMSFLSDYREAGKARILYDNHTPEIDPFNDEPEEINLIFVEVEEINPYDAVKVGEIIGSMKVKKEIDENGTYTV